MCDSGCNYSSNQNHGFIQRVSAWEALKSKRVVFQRQTAVERNCDSKVWLMPVLLFRLTPPPPCLIKKKVLLTPVIVSSDSISVSPSFNLFTVKSSSSVWQTERLQFTHSWPDWRILFFFSPHFGPVFHWKQTSFNRLQSPRLSFSFSSTGMKTTRGIKVPIPMDLTPT